MSESVFTNEFIDSTYGWDMEVHPYFDLHWVRKYIRSRSAYVTHFMIDLVFPVRSVATLGKFSIHLLSKISSFIKSNRIIK